MSYSRILLPMVSLLAASTALAQEKKAPAAAPGPAVVQSAAAPAPDRTTASFGDWILRCDRRTDTTPAQRVCEISQTVQRTGDAGPQAQLAFGRLNASEPLKATVLLPVNIVLGASGVRLSGDSANTELAWQRCLPAGCFASATITEELLKKLRAAKDHGRLDYKDAAGRDVNVTVSFRGFGEAIDAYQREPTN